MLPTRCRCIAVPQVVSRPGEDCQKERFAAAGRKLRCWKEARTEGKHKSHRTRDVLCSTAYQRFVCIFRVPDTLTLNDKLVTRVCTPRRPRDADLDLRRLKSASGTTISSKLSRRKVVGGNHGKFLGENVVKSLGCRKTWSSSSNTALSSEGLTQPESTGSGDVVLG